jgi:hypothetical protein
LHAPFVFDKLMAVEEEKRRGGSVVCGGGDVIQRRMFIQGAGHKELGAFVVFLREILKTVQN